MTREFSWSKVEKVIARRAFDRAYEREMKEIALEVRNKLSAGTDIRTVWRIHDYLSEKRVETDHKYDYRYSVLISVFGRLLAEGYLQKEDLEGLREDKMQQILSISASI